MERDRFEIDTSPHEARLFAENVLEQPESFVVVHDHYNGHQSCAAFVRTMTDGDHEANDKRIALFRAAPMLAEALARMVGWADGWHASKPRPYDDLQFARAALAAAMGEAK